MSKRVQNLSDIPDDTPRQEEAIIKTPIAPAKTISNNKSKKPDSDENKVADMPDEAIKSADISATKQRVPAKLQTGMTALLLFSVVLVLSGAGWLGVTKLHKQHQRKSLINSAVVKCSDALLEQAVTNLSPANVATLKGVVDQIVATPDYQRDSNCLYVITTYYVNISDPINAGKSLVLLKQTIPSDTMPDLNPILQANSDSIPALETSVDSLHANQKSLQQSTYGVTDQGQVTHGGDAQ